MTSVVSIVPKPTADEEVRKSVVETIEWALTAANAGGVTSVVIIALHPDGSWSDWHSATNEGSHIVGCLELAKYKRAASLLNTEE